MAKPKAGTDREGTLEALRLGWLGPRYDGLELDLKIIWNCNADIVVDVQGIEIGIENVHIDGVLAEVFQNLHEHHECMKTC